MSKESQSIEWKESWQDEHLKSICGFANAQGGVLYLGKDDSGHIAGLKNAQKLLQELPNKIRDKLGLMPQINLIQDKSKEYLEVIVAASSVPISLRGSYYFRSGSVIQELKGPALNDFLLKKSGLSWDRTIEEGAGLEDIDEVAVQRFKDEASRAGRLPNLNNLSVEETLTKLRLLTERGMTKAALITFGKDPGMFYSNLFVKIGRFGKTTVDIRFQEICEGNLMTILADVIEMLERKFLIRPVGFEGIRRIEVLEYPVAALREILLNALVHRDYTGSMTQIRVMNGSLSIWNAGKLPEGLTVKQLFQAHASIPRNPLIAEVCYKAGYIDSWGRGIEKIIEACKDAELPAPIIAEQAGGVVVELRKTPAEDMEESALIIAEKKSTPWSSEKSTIRGSEKIQKYNTKGRRQGQKTQVAGSEKRDMGSSEKIILMIKESPAISARQIAEQLGLSQRAIEKHLSRLKKEGKIKRIGAARGGYWKVIKK